MPIIKSPNADLKRLEVPTEDPQYPHPVETERGVVLNGSPQLNGAAGIAATRTAIPMAFQVTSPFNRRRVLLPHALVLHVNPSSLQETHNQKVERFQTRGGYVEQHWGHDLIEIAAEQSTGAFMHIKTGLTSVLRQRTIAWDRYRDLHDLYLNNGSVRDPFGNIVLQGNIMLLYDRNIYLGTFRSFSVDETDDSPFAFKLNWAFKVEHSFQKMSGNPFFGPQPRTPSFQLQNIPTGQSATTAPAEPTTTNPQVGGSPPPQPANNNPVVNQEVFAPPNTAVIPP